MCFYGQGAFYELVPWLGDVEWDVAPWGSWFIKARTDTLEAELVVTTDPDAGTPLRCEHFLIMHSS